MTLVDESGKELPCLNNLKCGKKRPCYLGNLKRRKTPMAETFTYRGGYGNG